MSSTTSEILTVGFGPENFEFQGFRSVFGSPLIALLKNRKHVFGVLFLL